MNLQKEFDKIIYKKMHKNSMICRRCGGYQTHKLIYCKGCGQIFTYQPHTYLDWLLAIQNRDLQDKLTLYNVNYITAIHKYELKKKNIDIEEFRKYLKTKGLK